MLHVHVWASIDGCHWIMEHQLNLLIIDLSLHMYCTFITICTCINSLYIHVLVSVVCISFLSRHCLVSWVPSCAVPPTSYRWTAIPVQWAPSWRLCWSVGPHHTLNHVYWRYSVLYMYCTCVYSTRLLSRIFYLGGAISPQVNTITTTIHSQEYSGGKLEVLGGKLNNLGGRFPPE